MIGYEAMGRAGIAVGPAPHMLAGFHPTSMSGVFGSAAAAGRLLDCETPSGASCGAARRTLRGQWAGEPPARGSTHAGLLNGCPHVLISALTGEGQATLEEVLVETVFAWPGVGLLAVDAIKRQDLPLLQADVFVVALIVVVLNLIIDLTYGVLDPRIRFT